MSELAARRMAELREGIAGDAPVEERIARTLDLALEQYAGALYSATLELSLAARGSDELRAAIAAGERTVGPQIQAMGRDLLGGTGLADDVVDARWTTAVSTARGYASLILLGHPAERVRAQWRASRDDVVGMLLGN